MTNEALEMSPKLPKTPGWEGLSDERKKWLQQETSHVLKIGIAETHAAIASAAKLLEIETGLKNTTMTMKNYLVFNFPRGEATGNRHLDGGRKLIKLWGAEAFNAVVRDGSLLRGYLGIGMNELIRVTEEIGPIPHSREPRQIEAIFEKKIRPALAERRVGRQKGAKKVKREVEAFCRLIFNSIRLYQPQTKGLDTSAEKKEAYRTIMGWTMEYFAVPGAIECKRIPIPDGTIATVGRPRNKATKKAGK